MKNVRLWFSKTASAKYISHLDLTRCMARALRMSKLPVWYTEGFNPRVYMSFSMPLSLGAAGLNECMDIRLTEEFDLALIPERLNEKLPPSIRIERAAFPEFPLDKIAFADYALRFECCDAKALAKQLEELFEADEITVKKHSKKGDKEIDIKPYFAPFFSDIPAENITDEGLKVNVRLPCSVDGGINPNLLGEALKARFGVEDHLHIVRLYLLMEDFSEIR